MSRPKIGKHHVAFPSGFTTRDKPVRLGLVVGRRSQRVRAALFDLPRSRLRSYLVACYFHSNFERWSEGDLSSFGSEVADDAPFEAFELGTYVGPEGYLRFLTEWRESFPSQTIELVEFVNPPGPDVMLVARGGARSGTGGIEIESGLLYVTYRIEKGNAVSGKAYASGTEALAAVGLSA